MIEQTDEFKEFCATVWDEVQRADGKHGDWSDVKLSSCINVTEDELLEAVRAEHHNDIYGEHGVVAETTQVASCCFKTIRKVNRENNCN